jgi:hypothetical protein
MPFFVELIRSLVGKCTYGVHSQGIETGPANRALLPESRMDWHSLVAPNAAICDSDSMSLEEIATPVRLGPGRLAVFYDNFLGKAQTCFLLAQSLRKDVWRTGIVPIR